MKKLTLSLLALALTSSAFAQSAVPAEAIVVGSTPTFEQVTKVEDRCTSVPVAKAPRFDEAERKKYEMGGAVAGGVAGAAIASAARGGAGLPPAGIVVVAAVGALLGGHAGGAVYDTGLQEKRKRAAYAFADHAQKPTGRMELVPSATPEAPGDAGLPKVMMTTCEKVEVQHKVPSGFNLHVQLDGEEFEVPAPFDTAPGTKVLLTLNPETDELKVALP